MGFIRKTSSGLRNARRLDVGVFSQNQAHGNSQVTWCRVNPFKSVIVSRQNFEKIYLYKVKKSG